MNLWATLYCRNACGVNSVSSLLTLHLAKASDTDGLTTSAGVQPVRDDMYQGQLQSLYLLRLLHRRPPDHPPPQGVNLHRQASTKGKLAGSDSAVRQVPKE
jgi:hypothetical protein